MTELKPCDCKSEVRVCTQKTPEFGNIYWVHCDKCGNDSGWYETAQQAIDAWNKAIDAWNKRR